MPLPWSVTEPTAPRLDWIVTASPPPASGLPKASFSVTVTVTPPPGFETTVLAGVLTIEVAVEALAAVTVSVAVSDLPEFVAVIVCVPAEVEPQVAPPQLAPSSSKLDEPVKSPRSTSDAS